MKPIRVRFAPSPTGALHIGGIRTALYNYLFAKKSGGSFLLRIEDTDQTRYVPGAEEYIIEALHWVGLIPDEGPGFGGEYGPYRQSERSAIYKEYAEKLIQDGHAYYAFDTAEEIEAMKARLQQDPSDSIKYDYNTRMSMKNSLTLSSDDVESKISSGQPYTIRMKIPADEVVHFYDTIREEVSLHTAELDDKVLIKSDGLPTYHMANVIDDRLMKITHVIRGEEWLSSTAHHVLLYRFFGWESEMPEFSHLPLILKPSGNGKLSKRDGAQFGFPVFPLDWKDEKTGDLFLGFREQGFLPEALLNFMALLGWNSGTEKEIFSLEELIQYFSKDKIGKSSSRFDYDKAKWFNQQYIQNTEDTTLAKYVIQDAAKQDQKLTDEQAISIIKLYKDRSIFLTDFFKQGKYLISDIAEVDQDFKSKKWKQEWTDSYLELANTIEQSEEFTKEKLEEILKAFMAKYTYKMGEVLPSLRVMMSGIPMGPDIYAMILTLSKAVFVKRIRENIIKLNK